MNTHVVCPEPWPRRAFSTNGKANMYYVQGVIMPRLHPCLPSEALQGQWNASVAQIQSPCMSASCIGRDSGKVDQFMTEEAAIVYFSITSVCRIPVNCFLLYAF